MREVVSPQEHGWLEELLLFCDVPLNTGSQSKFIRILVVQPVLDCLPQLSEGAHQLKQSSATAPG